METQRAKLHAQGENHWVAIPSFPINYLQPNTTPLFSGSLQGEPQGTASTTASSLLLLRRGPKVNRHARNGQIQLDLEREEKAIEKQTPAKIAVSQIPSPRGLDGLEANKQRVVWMISEVKKVSAEPRLGLEEGLDLE